MKEWYTSTQPPGVMMKMRLMHHQGFIKGTKHLKT